VTEDREPTTCVCGALYDDPWHLHVPLADGGHTAVAEDEYVDSGWRCHPTPDGRGWFKVHDRNSVHMDGCVPLYVKKSHADARLGRPQ
jgi:hypothetical protein